ncbi:hypothetical protein H634G_09926 [Metarhizium anisopliae BRIP 53293]|uniref:VOC domain-containing protein n=1 Tax=Metarhizium anisopliae BRIP 53293 TaxID=1291518 RepID=A0A0D9NLB7_METAN|nr:hypothetical protein H634G_09926 [Metarhizium anisopliae BRIP 53293]KJK94808.1 hypothetical protein H633G_01318 [Metarhizium anisopliae BRIP 53284]
MPQISRQDPVAVFNHIGISVPDCDVAVAWYGAVFGLELLKSVIHVKRQHFPDAPIFQFFDSALQEFKMAWVAPKTTTTTTEHAVGLEIFEFINPRHAKPDGPEFDYSRGGFFHVAMTVADPAGLCEAVVKAGGRKLGEPVSMVKGHMCAYCQDPWGNTIELLTASFAEMVSNGAGED